MIIVNVDLEVLDPYQDEDLIMGLFRKYILPRITPEERNRLNAGGQSHNAYIGRLLRDLKHHFGVLIPMEKGEEKVPKTCLRPMAFGEGEDLGNYRKIIKPD